MINHLAVIMDGNRRWAKKNSLMPWIGHKSGVNAVRELINFCIENKIKNVSAYTFSIENFKRSPQEVSYLFNLIVDESKNNIEELINNGVKISFCGDKSLFDESVKPAIKMLEEKTFNLSKLNFNVIFCYGGKQEIISAIKDISRDIKANKIDAENITPEVFDQYLWTKNIPDPDLIIRTGNIYRLSNFLLYKAAYSELYFTSKLWPEITKQDLKEALEEYKSRKRNFGL